MPSSFSFLSSGVGALATLLPLFITRIAVVTGNYRRALIVDTNAQAVVGNSACLRGNLCQCKKHIMSFVLQHPSLLSLLSLLKTPNLVAKQEPLSWV
jgi:hypothetical protein